MKICCNTILVFRARGFSLIELVIVVLIIGLISAIAIPRMSHGAGGAAESVLQANLFVVRNAIMLYKADHNGVLPGAHGSGGSGPAAENDKFNRQMLEYSNLEGETSATRDPAYPFGPYLQSIPAAPFGPAKGDSSIDVQSTGTAQGGKNNPSEAWKYDTRSGRFIFSYNGTSKDGTSYDSW